MYKEMYSTPKKRITQKNFAEAIRLESDDPDQEKQITASYMNQMLSGRKQVPTWVARTVGPKVGKDQFWMDTPPEDEEEKFQIREKVAKYKTQPTRPRLVRTLSMEQASQWRKHLANKPFGVAGHASQKFMHAEDHLNRYRMLSPGRCSDIAFAVLLEDGSMNSTSHGGTFIPAQTVVFIDPALEPVTGDAVLAVVEGEGVAIVRTLITDGSKKRLVPSNTVGYSTIDLEQIKTEIVGPAIGYYQPLRRNFIYEFE